MIRKLIEYCSLQTSKDKHDIEILIYGLQILSSTILTSIFILLCGVIVGQPIQSLIYLSILFLLRRNVGGYHSKTYLGCLFITILSFLIIILLENNLNQYYQEVIGIFFIIYSTIKIYMITPQVHENRVVDEQTIDICTLKKNRNLSIILFLTLVIHVLDKIQLLTNINYFFIISCSLMVVALSVKKIHLKEGNKHENNFS